MLLCTEPFLGLAQAVAQGEGAQHVDIVVIDHPLGSIPEAALTARIEQAAAGVLEILQDTQDTAKGAS